MTEGPSNPEIDALEQKIERVREALEKDMKQQETEIKAEISNLRTGVEKDIDYLKKLVYSVLVPLVIAVVGGTIVALLRVAGLV